MILTIAWIEESLKLADTTRDRELAPFCGLEVTIYRR